MNRARVRVPQNSYNFNLNRTAIHANQRAYWEFDALVYEPPTA